MRGLAGSLTGGLTRSLSKILRRSAVAPCFKHDFAHRAHAIRFFDAHRHPAGAGQHVALTGHRIDHEAVARAIGQLSRAFQPDPVAVERDPIQRLAFE